MKNILNRILGLDNSFVLFFLFSVGTSFMSYFYQVYLGKELSISDYGIYNSINSLCSNILCFYSPLSVFMCRRLATVNGDIGRAKFLVRKVGLFTGVVSFGVILVIATMFLGGYGENMQFVKSEGILLVTSIIVSGGIYSVTNGALQGANKLVLFGAVGFFAVAIKVLVTLLDMKLLDGVQAPLIAMLFSNVVIVLFIVRYLVGKKNNNNSFEHEKYEVRTGELLELYGITFVANILISPFINGGEIVLMSSEYDTSAVGLYSLAVTIVKASVYIISIFTSALLPRFASIPANTKRLYRKYLLAMSISFIIGVAWGICVATLGVKVIPILFGEGYREALGNVKYMSVWMINLGVILIINTFYLATNQLKNYIVVLLLSIGTIVFSVKGLHISFWNLSIELGAVSSVIILWALIDAINKMNKCVECE